MQSRESQEMPAFPMTEALSLESAKQIKKPRVAGKLACT